MKENNLTQSIFSLYKQNKTVSLICKELDIKRTTVYRHLNKFGKGYKRGRIHKRVLKKDFFKRIDSPEKAYIIGLIYADGYLNKSRYTASITLQQKDKYLLEKIGKETYQTEFHLTGCRNANRIDFYGKEVYEDMEKLGLFQCKSASIGFPNFDQIPEKFMPDFVRGAFDGDGCFSFMKSRGCYQGSFNIIGSKDFIYGLKNLLENEFKCKLCLVQDKRHPICFILSGASIDKIRRFYNYIYNSNEISLFLTRKKEKFEEYMKLKEKK